MSHYIWISTVCLLVFDVSILYGLEKTLVQNFVGINFDVCISA